MSRIASIAVTLPLAEGTVSVTPANDDPPVSPTQIKTLAVFKSGLGFFYRSGEAYLQKRVNWSPSYLVNLKDESTAEITLEAVLSNDVEDLANMEVSFVVGGNKTSRFLMCSAP